jgi:hypothetical protein
MRNSVTALSPGDVFSSIETKMKLDKYFKKRLVSTSLNIYFSG